MSSFQRNQNIIKREKKKKKQDNVEHSQRKYQELPP